MPEASSTSSECMGTPLALYSAGLHSRWHTYTNQINEKKVADGPSSPIPAQLPVHGPRMLSSLAHENFPQVATFLCPCPLLT